MKNFAKEFLYLYNVLLYTDERIGNLIESYYSNAAPPQVGSFLDLGEFTEEGYLYKVIKIILVPHKEDEIEDNISRFTLVRLFVSRVPEESTYDL